jgi:Mn2+/Fe2+ NRAMP family transporter
MYQYHSPLILVAIVAPLILSIPFIVAMWNDRNGDKHPNFDWILEVTLMIVVAYLVQWKVVPEKKMYQTLILSGAIFFSLFPFAVNYMLIFITKKIELKKDVKWYNHFSKDAIPDRWPFWNELHVIQRILVLVVVLALAIWLYADWSILFY